MERVLIIDCETSELGHLAKVIELGFVLYSITNQTTLAEFATLTAVDTAINHSEKVNHIKSASLDEIASLDRFGEDADTMIQAMLRAADCLVSYNVDFDARFFDPSQFADSERDWPWLCAMADFKWPQANRQQGSLIHLALEHGIGVSTAHRALTDCRLLAELFNRMPTLPEMFEQAMRPKARFQGLQVFEANSLAKEQGFKWDGDSKTWSRVMIVDDAASLQFRTRKLSPVSHMAHDRVTWARQNVGLF